MHSDDFKRVQVRTAALAAIFFVQWLGVHLCFSTHLLSKAGNLWADVLFHARGLPQYSAALIVVFLLTASQGWRVLLQGFFDAATNYRSKNTLVLQVCVFAPLFGLTDFIFNQPQLLAGWGFELIVLWILLILSATSLAFFSLAPWRYWLGLVRHEKFALSFAALVIGIAACVQAQAVYYWQWEFLRAATFETAAGFLGLFYHDVVTDPTLYVLGTSTFRVKVAASCSGYEGVGITITFLACYFVAFRKEFRFPQVLVLLPIGVAAVWLLNALRIALLVAIGTSISRDIALGGFHSKAGWIAVIVVGLTLVGLAHRWFGLRFDGEPQLVKDTSSGGAFPLLLPIIVLFSTVLFTDALTANFDWLYPFRVVTAGGVLAYFWKHYGFRDIDHIHEPLGIGALVFIAWILLVPVAYGANQVFAASLAQVKPAAADLWLLFRLVGAIFVVPIAEELAFRGYLLGRLSGARENPCATIPFSWVAVGISSVAFGALHSEWRAGIVAGVAYAIARYRRGRVSDAIVAHICTNTLLAIYVMATGEWSYW